MNADKHGWTYSRLEELGEEWLVELYDGVLQERPSPNLRHQKIIADLYFILESCKPSVGELYLSPVDLVLSESIVFIPDLMFVSQARLENQNIERKDGACIVGPPDLVVEVLSPSTARNDRVRKFNEYAAFGVLHYWIIDPDEQTLLAHALDEGRYTVEAALETTEVFQPTLFPNLQIPLGDLFGV